MEIALLSKNSLRIKGKNSVLVVDPSEKSVSNAALILGSVLNGVKTEGADIVINGPGEYETGGIKITGIKSEADLIYSMTVDSVSVIVGKVNSLSGLQNKLKESNVLVVNCDKVMDASFLTGLATNVIIFYGENATDIAKALGQENVKHMPKYAATIDKLPTEVETVILE